MAQDQNNAASGEKKTVGASNNAVTVKKSDLKKLETQKVQKDSKGGDAKTASSPKASAQSGALAKRRNEIIERRTRALAQARQQKGMQKSKQEKALKDGEKRPNVLVRMGRFIKKKFKEMWSELKKVTWPSGKDSLKQTLIVLGVVGCFLVVLLVMDLGLSQLLKLLVTREGS
ncbi:MAG: preprotein translocase subunit SecE [Clostridiales bacterium]|jgi:preprotein translocase subunit SecE|nr:preprotein translocase subunit SecE [Clostridiales bacterium]